MHLAALPAGSLEMPRCRFAQSAVVIRNDEQCALETARPEPAKCLVPCRKALGIANTHAENLPVAFGADARDGQNGTRDHAILLPTLDEQGIDHHEGVLALQSPFVERSDPRFQPGAQRAHRRFGEAGSAQLFGDRRYLACGDALHDHFHERQYKGLLAPLVALEYVRRKTAVPRLRNQQRHRTNSRVKGAGAVAVAVAGSFIRALVPRCPQRFRHLRLQYLIEHRLHQLCQSVLPAQKPWQQIRSYVNLIPSHRFFSFGDRSSRNVNLPNRSGGYLPPNLQQFRDSIRRGRRGSHCLRAAQIRVGRSLPV